MQEVIVKKQELLDRMERNLERHQKRYEEAVVAYRRAAIANIKSMLVEAEAGDPIRHSFNLSVPQNHSQDYRAAIDLIEMSAVNKIHISFSDFRKFARDEWPWFAQESQIYNTLTGKDYETGQPA